MIPHREWTTSRRDFLARAGLGFGGLALAAMMADEETRADTPRIDPLNPVAPRLGHFASKADHVIFLFMEGGPSHIDLFDPKPELTKRSGQPLPASFGKVFTAMGVGGNNLLATRRKVAQHGESGTCVPDW